MADNILQIEHLKRNLLGYAEKYIKIRPKKGGTLIPLKFNAAQMLLHNFIEDIVKAGQIVRVVICKGRQQGVSTYTAARFLHKATLNPGIAVFILAHMSDSTNYLFDILKRMYNNLPEPLRPATERSNRKELRFGHINSEYALGTAGSKEIGRGTNPTLLHGSECAFWDNTDELAAGLLQGVATELGTEIILESTANGIGNMFYNLCMLGVDPNTMSRFKTLFIPWYIQQEYREIPPLRFRPNTQEQELMEVYGIDIAQVFWRRRKIEDDFKGNESKFKQEYPCIAEGGRVSTNEGIFKIENTTVGCLTPQGKITAYLPKGRKRVYKVKTSLGYEIETTFDHLFKTADGTFCACKELKEKKIKLSSLFFSKKEYEFSFPNGVYGDWRGIITPEFARLLGIFMGDGSMYHGTFSIVFDERDIETIEWVEKFFPKFFGRKLQKRQVGEKGIELRIGFKELSKLFEGLGCLKHGKRTVKVPKCIWMSPKHVVKEFLKGVFDADGSVAEKCRCIAFFSKHHFFAQDIQFLLLGFGITAKLSDIEQKKMINGKFRVFKGFDLRLRAKEARLFSQEIGFISNRKIKKSLARPKGKVGSAPLEIVFEDTVIDISFVGEKQVYDLSVPQTNTFNVNGFVVHNCFLQEAFQSSGSVLINSEDVNRARKTTPYFDTMAPLVMGVDGAGEGADETAWVIRQGRRIVDYKVYGEVVKPMRLAGIVAQKIDSMGLDMVFLDTAYGYGCRDRLVEMGYGSKTLDIHFGSEALMPELYKNKRAQMYGNMKDWFEEGGCSIPDDEIFVRDIRMIPGFKLSGSRGLLLLPPKTEIKNDNEGHSPNCADALALTFSFPIKSRGMQSKIGVASPDIVRARSPFKSRRLAQTFVKQKKPSELIIPN